MKNYPYNFYKIIIENMNDGYAFQKIITDESGVAVDYEFIEVNCVFEKLTGLKREDVIGRIATTIFPGIERDEVNWIGRYGKVALTGVRMEFEGYFGVLNRWFRVNAFSPQPGYFITFFYDISAIKESEEQLLQAHKMEAIGNLSGGIAHDFNNLLTVINGHAEIAMNKLHRECLLEKDMNAIFQAGKRAENLTRQLLSFSRKQVVTPKVLDINESISGLEKMMRRLIGEDIGMEISLDSSLPCIKSDPGQIEQILVNLIVNARDALLVQRDSADEKMIKIETQRVYLEEDYVARHPGMFIGLHVLLKVSDNGVGMSMETKSKIFDPFFTTKEKGKGTGLGMATVYGIVKQNKGSVYVYSEPGLGTAFNIFWPATEEERRLEPVEAIFPEESQGTENILLVEDDEAVRDFAVETLESHGYRVLPASNGKDALQLIYSQDMRIDLLFTDVVMPQMNGVELGVEIEKIFPNCKIVYSSGYAGNQIIRNGELKEGTHFIRKPYSPREMAKKIREVLDEGEKSNF